MDAVCSQTPVSQPSHAVRLAAIGLLAFACAMGIGRFAFTPLLPVMQEEGLLSVSEGGVLASAHFLGYLVGAMLGARLPSSPRLVLGGSLLAIALATIAMGLTEDHAVWLAGRFASGVFSAFILVGVGTHIIPTLTSSGHAHFHGQVFSGVGAGIALVGLAVLAMMTLSIPSAPGWILSGAAILPVALYVWRAAPEKSVRLGHQEKTSSTGTRISWRFLAAYGTMGAGYIIPATFLPVMARDMIADPLIFGWGWPLFGAAAFASTVLVTRFYRSFSNLRIWLFCQFVMAAGLIAPALVPNIATVILAALCVGGTFMIITMAGVKQAHHETKGAAQSSIALLTTCFATGQIAGPILAGWAYDATGSFAIPLIATSIALVLTALLLRERETW